MNRLKNISQFTDELKDYRLSKTGAHILRQLQLVLLAGTSGSGRNTIIDGLVRRGGYHYIVSDTTRKPRVNNGIKEQNGVRYWFKSEAEFLTGLKQGMYLEAEIIHSQQISGISISELKKATDDHNIAITDIEIGGFNNVVHLKLDTVGIIVLPPSFEEWIRRLNERGELPAAEIKHRLETGRRIFAKAMSLPDAILVNDNLEAAIDSVDALAHGKKQVSDLLGKRDLAEELLKRTEDYLRQHNS